MLSPRKRLASAIYKDFYPFDKMFQELKVVFHPAQLQGVDALLLWGGEDISPSIYGHKRPRLGYSGPEKMSVRDATEVALAQEAIRLGIPILGICRGAQLACCLSGGSLFQHVTNHAGPMHTCLTDEGEEIEINSLHHQMMNVDGIKNYHDVAWIEPGISDVYITQDGPVEVKPVREHEIVFIPATKALCIQGHPEFMEESNPFVKYSLELVDKYVLSRTREHTDGGTK